MKNNLFLSLLSVGECKIDVVFLLDRSGSICDPAGPDLPDSWDYLIAFTLELIQTFDIGSDKVQVAVVTFGNKGNVFFYLDDYATQTDMEDALAELLCKKENTNTTGGLWVTRTDVFTEDGGKREDAEQVIIMVTDGQPTRDVEFLDDEVAKVADDGIRLIAIGIGEADEEFLTRLVNTPSDYYYLLEYAELSEIAEIVAAQVCGEEFILPTGNPDTITEVAITEEPIGE